MQPIFKKKKKKNRKNKSPLLSLKMKEHMLKTKNKPKHLMHYNIIHNIATMNH